jgi:nitrate reductase gamma subunit
MPAIVRSVIAVVAGYAAMVAVVIALTLLVKKIAPARVSSESTRSATYISTNLLYSFGAAMIGGYVAAVIGSHAPLTHACALAGIVLVMSVVSAAQIGDRQPRWYQAALALTGPLGAVLGGWIRANS